MNASRAWSNAGTKGAGVTVDVFGAAAAVDEASCSLKALAPDATVRAEPVDPGTPDVVVLADPSVGPTDPALATLFRNADARGTVFVQAAGDTGKTMDARSPGVVYVAAADLLSQAKNPTSSFGPQIAVAAYGNDTATASGYVAASAAILHAMPTHKGWQAHRYAEQIALSINPASSSRIDDNVGYGIIRPDQAVVLDQLDPASVPAFDAFFLGPVQPAPSQPGQSSRPSGAPSASGGGQGPTSQPVGSSGGSTVPATDTHAEGQSPSASQPPVAGSGGGLNPLLPIGVALLAIGGAAVAWQRRRRAEPPAVKPPEEWEPPSGPRHSGYSPPPD